MNNIALGAFILGTALLLIVGVYDNKSDTISFKEACVKVGGTPAYNGRNWECLK